jgi:hypothetical protein
MQASEKSVFNLAAKIADLLAKHPSRSEAVSALVIARELFSLDAPTGFFVGKSAATTNKSLH